MQKELTNPHSNPHTLSLLLWGQTPFTRATASLFQPSLPFHQGLLCLFEAVFCIACQPNSCIPNAPFIAAFLFLCFYGEHSYFLRQQLDLSLLHFDGFTSLDTLAVTISWMNDWNLSSPTTTSLPSRILDLQVAWLHIQIKNPTCTTRWMHPNSSPLPFLPTIF